MTEISLPNTGKRPSVEPRHGFRFRKPKSPNGWRFGFAYRFFVIAICSLCSSAFAVLFAIFWGVESLSFLIWAMVVASVVLPVLASEAIRYRLYDAVVSEKDEFVTLDATVRGVRVSEKDAILLSDYTSNFQRLNLGYRDFLKRLFDFGAVMLCLPFLLPFMAMLGAIIALDGHSPFFRQERIGRNGQRFYIWKFRTMVPNAEEKLENYLAHNAKAREEWDRYQRLKDDPRITAVGRFFRRTSVDELPQLINVLRGDMSLVGPRPLMPAQQALYPGHLYYTVRPGLTGLWQISERSVSSFADRAIYDDAYVESVSFPSDLAIILRTVGVVFRATGI